MVTFCAGNQARVRAGSGVSPHFCLTKRDPDISGLTTFGSIVYAFDPTRPNSSFRPRGVPVPYVGPAPAHGIGAVNVLFRKQLRTVRTVEYAGRAAIAPTKKITELVVIVLSIRLSRTR